ncbi:hypothetical protein EK21DRAFT_86972 [Setomelanomma holmii]|uniref:Uncharacterized protein n=1 Tax=Setomelanomma holmii TaxID=210430 RepID=A0A9P4HFG3_9PLEO|nr:hypothetical protein EK21DRAFT_86972 [Setomelanomma holmii]
MAFYGFKIGTLPKNTTNTAQYLFHIVGAFTSRQIIDGYNKEQKHHECYDRADTIGDTLSGIVHFLAGRFLLCSLSLHPTLLTQLHMSASVHRKMQSMCRCARESVPRRQIQTEEMNRETTGHHLGRSIKKVCFINVGYVHMRVKSIREHVLVLDGGTFM